MEKNTLELISTLKDLALGYGLDIIGALVILIAGWVAAGWARRLTFGALGRIPRVDDTLKPILANSVRYVILAFVFVAVLARFGVETTSIIAVFGAAGLAIGLALQGTLSNIAAGVMLLLLRPFSVGEYVDAGGISGTVEEIGLFTTRIKTAGGLFLAAPNSSLWNSVITNYSRNSLRRIDLVVGIGYNDDLKGAMAELEALMNVDVRILKDPAAQVFTTELAENSVNLTLRCWVNSADYWATLTDLTRDTKLRLDDKGYSIPYPQRDVHMV
ncbi:MAG: mechanosensitive ion channel [Rhodospirillales bacterium]|nr:mechanosensitive ion channel [Rhodospirillales bacterium]